MAEVQTEVALPSKERERYQARISELEYQLSDTTRRLKLIADEVKAARIGLGEEQ